MAGEACYKNRFGETFYLHSNTRARRIYYKMSKTPTGALESVPPGFEIRESVNGYVSVGRVRRKLITDLEFGVIVSALGRLHPNCYKAEAQGRHITIFASAEDGKRFSDSIDSDFAEGFATALEEIFSRRYGRELVELFRARRRKQNGTAQVIRYYPIMRFELVLKETRNFRVQRIYFSGDKDWLTLETLPLSAAVMKYIPHLGRDSFFDLL